MDIFPVVIQYIEFIAVLSVLIVTGILFRQFNQFKESINQKLSGKEDTNKLKLQALERLTLYCERSSLKNLALRNDLNSSSAAGLHQSIVETLKAEYEYNITQQIYVSPEIWQAIIRLKDQNIFIINQLAATMPANASAIDLSKAILEFSMNEKAELSTIVLNALQFEAKNILS